MPEFPDLSKHPSPVIQSLAPHIRNLYDVVEIAIPEPERVESIQELMRKAANDVLKNDDFNTFDAVIQSVSLAVHHSTVAKK